MRGQMLKRIGLICTITCLLGTSTSAVSAKASNSTLDLYP